MEERERRKEGIKWNEGKNGQKLNGMEKNEGR